MFRRQHPSAQHPAAGPLKLLHFIEVAGRMHSHQVGDTRSDSTAENRGDASGLGLSVELQRLVRYRPEGDVAVVDAGADCRPNPRQDGFVCRDVLF